VSDAQHRTPALLDAKVLKLEPLTQWWHHEDIVWVALRSVNRIPVLTIGGALDRQAVFPCRRALEAALRARPPWLLIDLASVGSGDGSGAGLLEAMRRAAAWHGARVWLAGLPTVIRQHLERADVLGEFPVSRNAARAIEEIRRGGTGTTARRPLHVHPRTA
jgi:anti-anti-sigma regulatory factor